MQERSKTISTLTNWIGALSIGVAAVLVALNNPVWSKWAYVAYPLGNALLLAYFIYYRNYPQILLNIVMLVIAAVGATCWFIAVCS